MNPDGSITAEIPNPAVSPELLGEILLLKAEHCTDEDIITHLRPKTAPEGYEYSTWMPGIYMTCDTNFNNNGIKYTTQTGRSRRDHAGKTPFHLGTA